MIVYRYLIYQNITQNGSLIDKISARLSLKIGLSKYQSLFSEKFSIPFRTFNFKIEILKIFIVLKYSKTMNQVLLIKLFLLNLK
jgi:hypothetical protein